MCTFHLISLHGSLGPRESAVSPAYLDRFVRCVQHPMYPTQTTERASCVAIDRIYTARPKMNNLSLIRDLQRAPTFDLNCKAASVSREYLNHAYTVD